MKQNPMTKTTLEFVTIAEARAHFLKQGFNTIDIETDSCIMTKHSNGVKVGEVIINKEGFMKVSAELITTA